jgi:peptidoglycan hydrolase-like protein with peptidoglycan-binding domain
LRVTSQVSTRALLAVATAGVLLFGCAEQPTIPISIGGAPGRPGPTSSASTTASTVPTVPGTDPSSSTTPDTATSTSADVVPPAAAVIEAGPKGLSTGAKGAAVTALEQRLTALRFNSGAVDGAYDRQLTMAVMAFQKQQGLPRTGRADPATLASLAAAGLGAPMVASGEPTRVEIDLPRQIAQFWKDGRLVRVLAVSTGNGRPYCAPKDKGGACDVAITPGGSFRADRKIKGLRESALGSLYDPVYFYGGIAIHGSGSIPATPASHGCVRVPMWESAWVYNSVAVGDPVYVVGGKTAPVPFGETAPVETPDEVTVPPTDPEPAAAT